MNKLTPRLNINFLGKRINSFHFFGIVGYISGLSLGILLAVLMQWSVGIILLMGLVGAIIFFILAYGVKLIQGEENIVYYHHEIAIVMACALVLFWLNKPMLLYLDITILGIGVFLAFGRIGCFSVGCCHGKPCKHGVTYGDDHVQEGFNWYYKNITLFPIQLVESLFAGIVVIVGVILILNDSIPGTVFLFYSLVYAVFRFFIEFLRGDFERPLWFGASEAQWTSVVIALVLLLMTNVGWFPYYSWHTITALFLVLVLLLTLILHNTGVSARLTSHKHIREMARGISFLNHLQADNQITDSSDPRVNLFKTSAGFNLSKTPYGTKGCFYTVSYKRKLTESTLEKITRILKNLHKNHTHFSIREAKSNVYHILFWNDERISMKHGNI